MNNDTTNNIYMGKNIDDVRLALIDSIRGEDGFNSKNLKSIFDYRKAELEKVNKQIEAMIIAGTYPLKPVINL